MIVKLCHATHMPCTESPVYPIFTMYKKLKHQARRPDSAAAILSVIGSFAQGTAARTETIDQTLCACSWLLMQHCQSGNIKLHIFNNCAAVACAPTTSHLCKSVKLAMLQIQAALITLCYLRNHRKGVEGGGRVAYGRAVLLACTHLACFHPTTSYDSLL